MNRDERKRKFNEAIVNLLYPSSPQSEPSSPQLEQELEPEEALIQASSSDVISGALDDYENASSSGEEKHDSEPEKLTRAQRKKIRKKKLKEEVMLRGKLIGPLLPLSPATPGDQVAEHAPPVRSNASVAEEPGDEPACANSKKVKHRRMAKRHAKEKRVTSTLESCNQSSTSSSAVDTGEAPM